MNRVVKGFFLAPLIPALTLVPFASLFMGQECFIGSNALVAIFQTIIHSYILAIILALPLYFLLRKINYLRRDFLLLIATIVSFPIHWLYVRIWIIGVLNNIAPIGRIDPPFQIDGSFINSIEYIYFCPVCYSFVILPGTISVVLTFWWIAIRPSAQNKRDSLQQGPKDS